MIAALVLVTCAAISGARLAGRTRSPRIRVAGAPLGARRTAAVVGRLGPALARADVALPGEVVVRWWGAGVAVGAAGGAVAGGAALAVLVAVGAAVAVPAALHLARHRADRRLERDLPDALDALARSLRSGGSLRQAIVEVAASTPRQLGDDLSRVARELESGVGVAGALDGWRIRRPLTGVRLTASALALGADTGGASARAVDGLAQTLRTNVAIEAEVRALSSQARLSALVIACAPLGFTVLAAIADPRIAHFLLRTPAGLLCLALGLGLDAAGALWMRALSVVRA